MSIDIDASLCSPALESREPRMCPADLSFSLDHVEFGAIWQPSYLAIGPQAWGRKPYLVATATLGRSAGHAVHRLSGMAAA